MLGEWVRDWSVRHEHILARERSLIPVRVGRQTYFVTAGAAECAIGRTHDELFRAFEHRRDWGVDEFGRPSSLAVRGLASRRLADRLQDSLRARNGRLPDVALEDEMGVEGQTRLSVSPIDTVEKMLALKQSLATESPSTREIVLRWALGQSVAETAAVLGLESSAVRQRLVRFRHRNAEVFAA
jgi:DNA-directed RNA polymerase specialized sigma24 family protein